MPTKYYIRVASNAKERKQFVCWLLQQGHHACISEDTRNYINNTWTSINEKADQIMMGLWNDYYEDAP